MEFTDQVTKQYDSRYCLSVSKDHNRGIVIQVARLNPTQVADADGKMTKTYRPVVMQQKIISLVATGVDRNDITFKSEEDIKAELTALIQSADAFALKCIASENVVDTIFMDLVSTFTPNG